MLLQPSAPPETTTLLRSVPLFADATAKELDAIARVARTVEFPAGSIICAEGVSGVGLHVIAHGSVSVTSSHSAPVTLGAGAYFGEIAVVDGGPRMATVTAETAVTTLAIVSWELRTIMDTQPQVMHRLVLELCRRLRDQAAAFSH
jgi:voltage-gated potassium channel